MVFSSLFFLFFYLPVMLAVYHIAPLRLRNGVLFIFSLIFYAWGEPVYISIMLLSIIIDYTHGMLVERAKARGNDRAARRAVASSVALNLALLLIFKYWDFLADSFAAIDMGFMPRLGLELPIGISFYTFQTMSYTIDIYRGDARVQRSILRFGTFVALFPQLIAGPILKYKELGHQIDSREHTAPRFAAGVQLFVIGLCKKVLLANNLGALWDACAAQPTHELTMLGAWLGVLAFSFQIYFDFSGYSDMATGLGRMLGFEFPRNFNYPYIARSITEFWRRWHISLSTWFRDYLYIPLGGNRVPTGRLCLNLIVVWAVTGIWHGANWNYMLWGLGFGALLILEKLWLANWLDKLPIALCRVYTLLLLMFSWAIFAIEDFHALGGYLSAMLGAGNRGVADDAFFYYIRSYVAVLVAAAVASTPLAARLWARLPLGWQKVALPVLIIAGMLTAVAYLVDGTYNPFLYFRF